jgi:hypothetical protein
LSILEFVNRLVITGLILLAASSVSAQVFFRNDFLINHKRNKNKVENLGLRFVSINLTNHPNWNQLINGRGGGTLVIDVRALRQPSRRYSYTEIAEKVYVPATMGPRFNDVPQFLLQQPPVQRRFIVPVKRLYRVGI